MPRQAGPILETRLVHCVVLMQQPSEHMLGNAQVYSKRIIQ